MKNVSFYLLVGIIFIANVILANGVAIKNAEYSDYFRLLSSDVEATVYDQIAIVVSTQKFLNNTGEKSKIKYAFPLVEGATGTGLRWKIGNIWYTANLSPSPQDTTLPGGGGGNTSLQNYLGDSPLFFNLEDSIASDSILTIELTYVQLLPYDFYEVSFFYPNDYSLIQNEVLDFQHIHFSLESQRTITNIELTSHTPNVISYNDSIAEFDYEIFEAAATIDYQAYYELSPEDLGLFSYSTFITDTAFGCDEYGNGFFTFIVEPDPQSEVIQKVFTLIIDRSGSMSGDKITQAIDAASYIVENLNEGDYFNIVDFASDISAFEDDHVLFNPTSQSSALSYISSLYATGSTNISGAFSNAIPDFATSDTTLANIIIFLTDGQATTGITSTNAILQHIQDLIIINEVSNLQIHTFGIGDYTNEALLSQIASQNNGLCKILGDDELEEEITRFYRKIRNPVLINTEMTVDPPVLVEVFPNPLDNLYLGQQLIVVGRYENAANINVSFSGDAFGQPQTYQYSVELADTTILTYQFLTKLWAKKKMENLMILYHTFSPESQEADEIMNEIIDISICYNVISPFTSYTGGGITFIEYDDYITENAEKQCYAYPNPTAGEVNIEFVVRGPVYEQATIHFFDSFGRLIDVASIQIMGQGTYKLLWRGTNSEGNSIPAGYYYFIIQYNNQAFKGEIIKL
ncbi:MAG: VWA domain-containing protein [Bacteroidota bacterium]